MKFPKDTTVILRSFLGTVEPEEGTDNNENYWQLIGEKGKIIEDHANYEDRILVLFDKNLDDYGLANHNPIKNSLWIRKADLMFENE